jgi:hypothetical protein
MVLRFYGVVRRLQKEHTCTYMVLFGDGHAYASCSKNKCVYMRVLVVTSAYKFV